MNTSVIANWQVKNEHLANVLTLASELQKRALQEKGIVSYQVFQSQKEPNKLTILEEYVSQEALMQHLQSEHYKQIAVEQIQPFLLERTGGIHIKL